MNALKICPQCGTEYPASNPADSIARGATPPTTFSSRVAPAPEEMSFDSLDVLANTTETARQALTVVGAKHLLSNEDRVRAALVTFSSKLSLEDGNACAALKTVASIAKGTTKANLVARKLRDLCSE